MPTMTITVETSFYRVNSMTNHPLTGEILFNGDVAAIPAASVTDLQLKDGLFTLLPNATMENRVQRGEPTKLIGINISEQDYLREQALGENASELPPSVVAEARRTGARAAAAV